MEGVAEITLEHPVDELGRWEYLVNDNVIAAPTPYSKKQLFRIYDHVKTESGVTAYARHIFYDSAGEVLLDVRPTKKTGQEALDIILNGTKYKAKSDIKRQSTAYYVRKNIMEAIAGDDENSFLNRWGGERMYDNFTVIINDRLGGDYGASAEFGRNVTGIEADANIDDVVTRIIPVAYNGYMLDGEKPWVDSPLIGNYANVRAAVIKFEDVKLLEDCQEGEEGFSTLELLREELKRRCEKEFENGRDKPTVNYKVDLVEISDTDAYKEYSRLATIGIGDDVLAKDRVLNINVTARCIRLLYDCIEETNLEVEIGNFAENYFDKTTSAADLIQKVTREDGTLKAETVYGKIDGVKAQLRAQRDISQPSPVRATVFEDLVEDSPTYGAMSIGTMGFCIASERTADGKDWDWKTFGTGAGFYADYICVGQLDGALIKADSIQADAISIEYKKSVESHISEAIDEVERTYENNLENLKSEFSKTYTTFGYVDQTAGSLANEAESNANKYADSVGSGAKEYTNEQLKSYATTTKMNTAINQTAEIIKTEASKTYTTFGYVDQTAGSLANEAESNANKYADSVGSGAKEYTNEQLKNYTTTVEMNAAITTVADSITLEVNKKVGSEEVSSIINQKADSIRMKAAKLMWESENSSLDENGIFSCKGAKISGEINTTKKIGTSTFYADIGNINTWYYGKNVTRGGFSVRKEYGKYTGEMSFSAGYSLYPGSQGAEAYNIINSNRAMLIEARVGDADTEQWSGIRMERGDVVLLAGYQNTSIEGLSISLGSNNNEIYGSMSGTWKLPRRLEGCVTDTTTNAPNVWMGSSNTAKLSKSSSSSKRYKHDITSIDTDLNTDVLYNLPVRSYTYNDDYLSEDDRNYRKRMIGFIAEEVAEIYPKACQYDDQGRPEMWNVQIMVPALLDMIQKLHTEVTEIKENLL